MPALIKSSFFHFATEENKKRVRDYKIVTFCVRLYLSGERKKNRTKKYLK